MSSFSWETGICTVSGLGTVHSAVLSKDLQIFRPACTLGFMGNEVQVLGGKDAVGM